MFALSPAAIGLISVGTSIPLKRQNIIPLARLLLAQNESTNPSWGDKLDLWLEDKLHMPLTASDIAGALNISISTLTAAQSKSGISISIMQYVMQKRLAKSAELLKYTSLTIENIALAVGYDSHSAF